MTEKQLHLLLAYVDARITEKVNEMLNSDNPTYSYREWRELRESFEWRKDEPDEQKPIALWCNEYADGSSCYYDSKKKAESYATNESIRVAVPYKAYPV